MSELTLEQINHDLVEMELHEERPRLNRIISAYILAKKYLTPPEVPEDVREFVSLLVSMSDEDAIAVLLTAFMEKLRPEAKAFNNDPRLIAIACLSRSFLEELERFHKKGDNRTTYSASLAMLTDEILNYKKAVWDFGESTTGEILSARDASIRKEAEEKAKLKAVWDEHFNLKIGNVLVARMFRPFPNTPQAWCVQLMWADPSRESAHKGDFTETEARGICDAHASQLISSLIASLSAEEGA